jgi:FxsC-like protein
MSTAQDLAPAGEVPYFFLSYARTPRLPGGPKDPDKWIAKLYLDLCTNVIQFATGRSATVGFMDREMLPGAHWPKRLAQALACCRVFVPLYSPRYFDSEECGKEWFAFSRRVNGQAARLRQPPVEAIVPALWVPVEPARLPEAARSIQFDHHSLGARYSAEGFWGIMKVNRYRSDYQLAVMRLAQHIVHVAHQTMLGQDSPADYMSLTSVFDDPARHGQQWQPDPAGRGGRRIHIMIAAPRSGDLPTGRQESAYYGANACEWNPYHPESRGPLADYAADLATRLGYRPAVVAFDEPPGAEAATPVPAPALFLVDPWAAAVNSQATQLREFDKRAERWISVLMPWNRADGETMAAEPTLRPRLAEALSNMLSRTPPQYRQAANDIPTQDAFADIMPPMARVADNRFLREARAYPPAGPMIPRPTLSGPNPFNIPGEHDE